MVPSNKDPKKRHGVHQSPHRSGQSHFSDLQDETAKKRIILVGNANVGKSVIFGCLTGKYADVSNYPGTTVEITRGTAQINGRAYEIIDTPGIKSLLTSSEDENVTRRIILDKKTSQIVHVADAKNLRRALHLALQLAETGLPQILVLNMVDEAEIAGIQIDYARLSLLLGLTVVPTVAVKGKGISDLRKYIVKSQDLKLQTNYPAPIQNSLQTIENMLREFTHCSRATASLVLMGEQVSKLISDFPSELEEEIGLIVSETAQRFTDPLSLVMTKSHENQALQIIDKVLTRSSRKNRITDLVSEATIHPISGLFIFFGILALIFALVGYLGAGILVDLLESQLFGEMINPWITDIVEEYVPFAPAREILIGEYGVITVGITYAIAIVFPLVAIFFLAFAFLEDSGYLPRLALMGNRVLSKVGLHGKAVLPLVLGTGCGTMATMSTRILETKRERIIATLMLALGIPCSAQLGVILGLMTFVSPLGMIIVFGVVISQVLLVAYLANLLLPGERSDFIMEIPPLRMPKLKNLLMKTWVRIEWFLAEAIPLFLIGTFLVSIANLLEIGSKSLLDHIVTLGEPIVVGLLGLPEDATVALILGFLRRDYGVAGLFDMARAGELSNTQMVVGSVVLTLFVPCIASFFMIIKEYGPKVAFGMLAFIIPFAILVGSVLNLLLIALEVPV
ncbi:MAG: ferrous iron transport protein B [Candidatus Hodarchaeales archaeon]|jgi:ferrous iron transport protein B